MIARVWSIEIWFEFCHVSVFCPHEFFAVCWTDYQIACRILTSLNILFDCMNALRERHSKVLIWFLFFHYLLDLLFVLTTYKHFWTHGKKQTATALQKTNRSVKLSLIPDKKNLINLDTFAWIQSNIFSSSSQTWNSPKLITENLMF